MTAKNTTFDGQKAYEYLEHLTVTIGARLTGTPGEHKAAAYIARQFKSFGLKVTQQRFPCLTFDNRKCTFEVREGRRWRQMQAEPVMLSKSTPPAGVEGEIFYAENGKAEYLTPAMKDKIVLICGRIAAKDRHRVIGYGPKAIVMIDPMIRDGYRREVLDDLNRKTFGSLPMAAINHLDGIDVVTKGVGRARLVLRNTEKKSHSINVIGELAGTEYPEEIVVVCAHYDSHWRSAGATDNGGGAAVMMELARVLASRPSKRTLRFIAFAAEETGLHGSTFYANELARADRRDRNRPSFNAQADDTECTRHLFTFNVDTQGAPLGEFHATFTGVEDVGASLRLLAKEVGTACEVVKKPMSSDGTPLAAVGIPNIQFARRGGTHRFGHQAGDDISNVHPGALHDAGVFAQSYLQRYVTDAVAFPFAREIPEDQAKAVREYFAKGKLAVPGQEPTTKPRAARRRQAHA